MNKLLTIAFLVSAFCIGAFRADAFRLVDASTNAVLPLASITDRNGNVVGMTDKNGEIPTLQPGSYPVTFNYMGYAPFELMSAANGDIKMSQRDYSLPEIVITPGSRPLLHLTGYMRELFSVLSPTDSVTLFRERVVDFMFPIEKSKVKGWKKARELASRSYVKMTDSSGLDSISDHHEYEYMLLGDLYNLIPEDLSIPQAIAGNDVACDTIMGKYYPKIIWWKNGNVTRWIVDGLADEKNHMMSPWVLKVFGLTTDFTDVSKNYVFNSPDGDRISPSDLKQASVTINMLAKGKLFKNSFDSKSPVHVRTYVELYLTDREFLSDDEGKEIKKSAPAIKPSEIQAPVDAAPLHPAIQQIVERYNALYDTES